jgi:hypothetical protein
MRITSGGNVGIGTTSPNNLLQVGGTTNGIIRIDGAGDNTDFGIKWASSNASIYSNTGNAYLTFATNGSERMRIASNGNIGIGTSSPSEKLHIKNGNLLLDSDAGFSPGIWMPDLNGNPSLRIVTDQIDASYTSIINAWGAPNSGVTVGTTRGDGTAFQVRSEVSLSSGFATDSGSTRFIVNGNGNVGIGTTSPSYKLDITALGYGIQHYGNSTNSLRTYAGSGYQVIEATTSTGVSQFGYVSGNFFIEAGGSERMRITSGGNVGIGTASPSAMLTLLGLTPFIRIERSGVNTWQIQNNNNVGTITGFSINNVTAGTTPFFINQDTGNLLLGATADNGFRLDVNGTGRFSASGNSLRLNSTSNDVWATFIPETGHAWRWQARTTSQFSIYNETLGVFPFTIESTGAATFSNLAGSGTRMVVADANGLLSTQAIGSGSITGSGTTNYLPKFTGTSTIGNSLLFDNGSSVGIGTTNLNKSGSSTAFTVNTATAANYSAFELSSGDALNFYINANNANSYIVSLGSRPMIFNTNGNDRMTLDSSGNLGLGVTPSAWVSTVKAIDISSATALWAGGNGQPALGYNVFVNTSGNLIYKTSEFASRYEQISGQHQWYTAPSGTAGNAISFTQAMTLDANGRLALGGTTVTDNTLLNIQGSSAVSNVGIVLNKTNSTAQVYGIINQGPLDIYNYTASSYMLRITTGGNLLVGTTTDAGFKLDVNGTGRFTGQVDSLTRFYVVATPPATNGGLINVRDTVTATNVTSFGGVFFNSSPGSDYSIGKLTENGTGFLQIRNANSGAELLRINASGAATFSSSVTANARSFIQGAAGYLFDVQTTDANQPRFQVYVDDTNGVDLISGYNSTAKSLRFVTGNTPRMTITSGGNVLIGTQTTPTPVSGVAFPLTVSSSAATRIRIDSTNASPNSGVGLYANGVQKFSFAMYGATSDFTIYNDALLAPSLTVKGNNSNVLIGTTTDTSDKLRVDGNTFTNTITTYRPGVNTTKSDAWKLGRASIGTQPTETHQITVEIGGVSYVIGAAQL